jgi:hypothetical protein
MGTPFRGQEIRVPGLAAGADLSANQYRFVKPGATEGQVVAIAAAADKPIGVQYDTPSAAGRAIEVASGGIVEVTAGAAIAYGAEVQTNATGKAITATTGGTVVGRALQAAAADGDRISILANFIGGRVL